MENKILKIGDKVKVIKVGFYNQKCKGKIGTITNINFNRDSAPYQLDGEGFEKFSCWSIESLEKMNI